MPLLDIPNREQLDAPARDALESVLANLIGYLYTEHDDQGSHDDIVADSLTLREGGAITLSDGTTLSLVDGVPTLTDALTVDGVVTSEGAVNNGTQVYNNIDTYSVSGPSTSITPQGGWAGRVTVSSSGTLSNIINNVPGALFYLVNTTSTAFTILHDTGGSFAFTRILCPGSVDLEVSPNAGVLLWYDETSARWRVVAARPPITTAEMNTAKIARTLFSANGTQQNSSFVATNVFDKTIPANTFNTNGQSIHWVASGAWTANGNTKQVDPQFDGISLVALGPAVINTAGARWWFDAHIHRANSTNMHCVLHFVTHNAAGAIVTSSAFTTDNTMDWTAAIDLDLLLTGGATGDVTVNYSKVVFYPEGA